MISAGQFLTGHYSYVKQINSWQGGNGQSIQSIIDEVNNFTFTFKELVILNLSHDLNTDVGNTSYRPLMQSEWNNLLQQPKGLDNLYVAPSTAPNDLSQLQLGDFIGGQRGAVVVVVRPDNSAISLGPYANQGFYTADRFSRYDVYSESNDVKYMAKDQLDKLQKQRPTPDSPLFLLSWTLTQDGTQASTCVLGTARSIRDLAGIANPQLYRDLLPACSAQCYPDILYTDYVQTTDVTAMAMAINWLPLS